MQKEKNSQRNLSKNTKKKIFSCALKFFDRAYWSEHKLKNCINIPPLREKRNRYAWNYIGKVLFTLLL